MIQNENRSNKYHPIPEACVLRLLVAVTQISVTLSIKADGMNLEVLKTWRTNQRIWLHSGRHSCFALKGR